MKNFSKNFRFYEEITFLTILVNIKKIEIVKSTTMIDYKKIIITV